MSTAGRGRGYTGRHHLREPRPGGDPDLNEELEAARTLAELSPRATGNVFASTTIKIKKSYMTCTPLW